MPPTRGRKTSDHPGGDGYDSPGKGKPRRDRRHERTRNENGQFADAVDTGDVLSVFDAVEGPVVTSTDVGDVLGITTEAARQRLNELVSGGRLRRRKTGRTIVYWQIDNVGEVKDI